MLQHYNWISGVKIRGTWQQWLNRRTYNPADSLQVCSIAFLPSLEDPDRSMTTYTFPSGSRSICRQRSDGRKRAGGGKRDMITLKLTFVWFIFSFNSTFMSFLLSDVSVYLVYCSRKVYFPRCKYSSCCSAVMDFHLWKVWNKDTAHTPQGYWRLEPTCCSSDHYPDVRWLSSAARRLKYLKKSAIKH